MAKSKKIAFITITIAVSACSILLAATVFRTSYIRLFETFGDFFVSLKFYFCELFGIEHNIQPTVIDYSKAFDTDTVAPAPPPLPSDYEGFKVTAKDYFNLLFSGENFTSYAFNVLLFIANILDILLTVLPAFILLVYLIKRIYKTGNTNHNEDTKPLKAFKKASDVAYKPTKSFVADYVYFIKTNAWIWGLWLTLWLLSLNLITIIVAFFAYYLYIAMSFDLGSIYVQVVKLIIDLRVFFGIFPWWCWLILAYPLFCRFRVKIAMMRLRHFEARNCGFINELPIVSITCGSMGKKKTTAITDMVLSQEVMFRQKALSIIEKNDMKFPYFPWVCFEKDLQKCMEYGTVYNLATVKEWVNKKRLRFEKHSRTDLQLYGYDAEKYSLLYDDNLKIYPLFEVLETYALAYFIYIIQSSLIVSNYSVRTDNAFIDEGNFPIWIFDFFPKGHRSNSRHANILDYDILRLGKKVIEDNPNIGSFEFGVVALSEIGKERGNNLELKEVKKGKDETNQKNDLFNSWLKMCRHSATVDNFPFIKVFTDEQRPESWGADARDLCDIVRIIQSSDQKMAMPFYTIEDMISEWIFNRFISLYYDFRFRRGDNTLFMYLVKKIAAFVFKRNIRMHNSYGFCTLTIEKERGTMDGRADKKTYYLMSKKIYSRRFSTDCFSDYFNELAKKSKVGLDDYKEYLTEKATIDELRTQNSYFINSLYRATESDSD